MACRLPSPRTFHLSTPGPPQEGRPALSFKWFLWARWEEGKEKLVTVPQFQAATTTLHPLGLLALTFRFWIRELGHVGVK